MGTYVRVTNVAEHKLARELRRSGVPYKRIASRIGVSASSVYAWTKDIELTKEQKSFNLRGPRGPQIPRLSGVGPRAGQPDAEPLASRLRKTAGGRQGRGIGSTRPVACCIGRREPSGVTRFSSQ